MDRTITEIGCRPFRYPRKNYRKFSNWDLRGVPPTKRKISTNMMVGLGHSVLAASPAARALLVAKSRVPPS